MTTERLQAVVNATRQLGPAVRQAANHTMHLATQQGHITPGELAVDLLGAGFVVTAAFGLGTLARRSAALLDEQPTDHLEDTKAQPPIS